MRIVAADVETGLAVRAAALLAKLAGAWSCCQRALLAKQGERKLLLVLRMRRSDELTRGADGATLGTGHCATRRTSEVAGHGIHHKGNTGTNTDDKPQRALKVAALLRALQFVATNLFRQATIAMWIFAHATGA